MRRVFHARVVSTVLLIVAAAGMLTSCAQSPLASAAGHFSPPTPLSGGSVATPQPKISGRITLDEGGVPMNGFLTETFTETHGASMTFYLHVPANYNPAQHYPLVLLLHGGGERGSSQATLAQNRDVILSNLYVTTWSSAAVQNDWPSFIVVPQVMGQNQFVPGPASEGTYSLAAQPTPELRMSKEIVDTLRQQYAGIDGTRLYVTGISMGAYGTWEAIERWPGYFAAAAPVSGGGDPTYANLLVHTPIWAFHGSTDTIVPVWGTSDMIQAVRAAGGHPLFTEYQGLGHGIWMQVYGSSAFMKWLFAQRLSS